MTFRKFWGFTLITDTRELKFVWRDVNIPIKIETNSRGFYAIVDSVKWESVHIDDLCSSALAMIEFLFDNGFELSGEWGGYIDNERSPIFWLKDK